MEDTVKYRIDHSLAACRALAMVAVIFGCAVAVGWAQDIEWLTRVLPTEPQTRASTAINFFLSGLSVLFLSSRLMPLKALGYLIGFTVLASCGLTIFEGYAEGDLELSHTLWTRNQDSPGLTYPGPMAPAIGIIFSAIALAITTCDLHWRKFYGNEVFAIIALVFSATTFVGNAAGVSELCTFAGCIRMPFVDSLLALCLASSILLVRPTRGVMAFVVSESVSGGVARRGCIALLLIPCLLWLRTLGEHAGLYDTALGWAAFGIATIALLALLFGLNASLLDKVDHDREESQKKLAELSQRIGKIDTLRLRHVCLKCSNEFELDVKFCPHDGSELARVAQKHYVGELFADKYEIVELLGEGGMSTVYKAKHIFTDRMLAIKVIHSHLSSDVTMIRRLQGEARTASSLNHPNLIAVHDFGIALTGEAFLVMDFLKGRNLSSIVEEDGVFNSDRFADILIQICSGLETAHKHGILHRDLKPSNVMLLERDGLELVKVVDFGMAKDLGDTDTRLTATNEIMGTPAYMSPEQCAGLPLDARSDIYSLGCLMYECLTSRPPFYNKSVYETLAAHLYKKPFALYEGFAVPPWLAEIAYKALEKKPEDRFQSASELKAAVEANVKVT